MDKLYISILRCPHGAHAIALESESGNGERLFGAKHCGQGSTVRRWPFDRGELDAAIAKVIAAECRLALPQRVPGDGCGEGGA